MREALPPLIAGSWRRLDDSDRPAILMRLSASLGARRSELFTATAKRVRAMRLACYPRHLLCELEAAGPEGARALAFLYGPGGMHPVTGQSALFHDLNDAGRLALDDAAAAAEYLALFSSGVHASEGRFEAIGTAADLVWRADAPPAARPAGPFAAPLATPATDGWSVTATIRYGHGLFTARFAVSRSGLVEMVDDTPVAADLPLVAERFDGLWRSLEQPQ